MRWNLVSAASETYELKIATFNNGRPEESLALMKKFKANINGIGTIYMSGINNYLRTMICGEALW